MLAGPTPSTCYAAKFVVFVCFVLRPADVAPRLQIAPRKYEIHESDEICSSTLRHVEVYIFSVD